MIMTEDGDAVVRELTIPECKEFRDLIDIITNLTEDNEITGERLVDPICYTLSNRLKMLQYIRWGR